MFKSEKNRLISMNTCKSQIQRESQPLLHCDWSETVLCFSRMEKMFTLVFTLCSTNSAQPPSATHTVTHTAAWSTSDLSTKKLFSEPTETTSVCTQLPLNMESVTSCWMTVTLHVLSSSTFFFHNKWGGLKFAQKHPRASFNAAIAVSFMSCMLLSDAEHLMMGTVSVVISTCLNVMMVVSYRCHCSALCRFLIRTGWRSGVLTAGFTCCRSSSWLCYIPESSA